MTYEQVADELYGLPPAEFTKARNERVRQARAAGDRDLAKRIGALRKPTQAAWLVNLLSRERRAQVEELLDLGEAFREAYNSGSGEQLRQLSSRRQRLVQALGEQAQELADAAGVGAGAAAVRDAESTLEAALADPDVAELCRSGRLTGAMAYAGFGPAAGGVAGVQAVPGRQPPKRPAAADRKEPKPRKDREAGEAREEPPDQAETARWEAEQRAAEARAVAERTGVELGARETAVDTATARRDDLQARIDQLRRDLRNLEQELRQAERELRQERSQTDRARSAYQRAQTRLERAESDLRAQSSGDD